MPSGTLTAPAVAPEEYLATSYRPDRESTRQADLEAAAGALYSKMPESAEIAGWLERQPT
jgi:hypothetical protein